MFSASSNQVYELIDVGRCGENLSCALEAGLQAASDSSLGDPGAMQLCLRMPDRAVLRVREDARTRRLTEIVESFAESWGGVAVNSIAWVEANLRLGSPSLMLKARL